MTPKNPDKMLARARYRLLNGLPMSTGEAGILIGVDNRTVGKWLRRGKIEGVHAGSHWRVPSSEVRRVLTEGFSAGEAALQAGIRGPVATAPAHHQAGVREYE